MGCWNRDKITKDELSSLKINICQNKNHLFPTFGRLEQFCFYRGPEWWIVRGNVPLITAEKLYNHSLGYAHILVVGNEMRPSPSEKRTTDLIHRGRYLSGINAYKWAVLDPNLGWVIPSYKIISFPATQLFIDIIREDKLIH